DELEAGRFRVGDHELGPDEVLVEQTGKEGWAVASADGVTVALDTALDPSLALEALVLDLIHQINALRKEQGLELTDRIRIPPPAVSPCLAPGHAPFVRRRGVVASNREEARNARLPGVRRPRRGEVPLLPLVLRSAAPQARRVLPAARGARQRSRQGPPRFALLRQHGA